MRCCKGYIKFDRIVDKVAFSYLLGRLEYYARAVFGLASSSILVILIELFKRQIKSRMIIIID